LRASDSTDSSLINLSTSFEGSFTLVKDGEEEQNLDSWEDEPLEDRLRSMSGRSSQCSTVVADDCETIDHAGAVADQPAAAADEGMYEIKFREMLIISLFAA